MINKTWIIVLLTLLSCGKVNTIAPFDAEKKLGSSYALVDQRVKDVPDDISYNITYYPNQEHLTDLVEYLTEKVSSTQDKSRVIHDWIAVNIFYDYGHYDASGSAPDSPWEVLRRRQAVCRGYTSLFYQMAQIAGLRVAKVNGAAANNHTWNAVDDGGVWQHIDVTFDAGTFRNGTLTHQFKLTYFYKSAVFMSGITNHAYDGGIYHYDDTWQY